MATILRDQNRGRRVEVLLYVDIDEHVSVKVAESVRSHPDSNEIWVLEATASISKRLTEGDANVGPTIPGAEAVPGVPGPRASG